MSESSEAPELVKIEPKKVEPKIDLASTSKAIRSILNKVSEGNIEPMFKQLMTVVDDLITKDENTFAECYTAIFNQLTINC